jgi:hypothetical protein
MPVRDSDAPVTVTFRLDDREYATVVRRGQIVHEAFHAALPSRAGESLELAGVRFELG